jgi:hypothetical protein
MPEHPRNILLICTDTHQFCPQDILQTLGYLHPVLRLRDDFRIRLTFIPNPAPVHTRTTKGRVAGKHIYCVQLLLQLSERTKLT